VRIRLSDYGDVDLDPVELEEFCDDETGRQVARTSVYTWELTNLARNQFPRVVFAVTNADRWSGELLLPGER
jgi:hypothetical protein